MDEGRAGRGTVALDLAAEFPGLALAWREIAARPGASPPAVLARLRALADRVTGARAVVLRAQPLGRAYRVFFRQIGLDPDITRVPSEEAAVRRLLAGGLPSRGLVEDARTIAVLETGAPVWALDAARVSPSRLLLRTAGDRERIAEDRLAAGELVVADDRAVLARLFGEVGAAFAPRSATGRIVLFTVGVDGVPQIVLEEALWLAAEVLGGAEVG